LKPAPFDLPVTRGDDFVLPFFLRSRDASGNKSSVSLAGYSFESKLIAKDGTLTTITVQVIDSPNGQVKLVIAAAVTATMQSGTKWYFAVTSPTEGKQTYMDGSVLVRDRGSSVR
jgi:hypothetical protein